ncbi:MAG: hypothetical protein KA508_05960 [Gammaproteobacteria bacterium]|nr:hypothetical protein [Gammaproteobacteria bacterium]
MTGSCSNPGQSKGSGATCERNCANEVWVKAYSRYNTNSCTWVYGYWASGTNQSTLRLNSDGSGGTVALSCGPCGTIAVPVDACVSGQYNSCACPAKQTWNGKQCVACIGGVVTDNVCTCPTNSCRCPSWMIKKASANCTLPTSPAHSCSNSEAFRDRCCEPTGGRVWKGTACVCPTDGSKLGW